MNHFSEVCLPHHIHSNLTSYQPSFVPSLTGSHLLLQSAKQILTSYEPDLTSYLLTLLLLDHLIFPSPCTFPVLGLTQHVNYPGVKHPLFGLAN